MKTSKSAPNFRLKILILADNHKHKRKYDALNSFGGHINCTENSFSYLLSLLIRSNFTCKPNKPFWRNSAFVAHDWYPVALRCYFHSNQALLCKGNKKGLECAILRYLSSRYLSCAHIHDHLLTVLLVWVFLIS